MSLSSDLPTSASRLFRDTRFGPLLEGRYLTAQASWTVAPADLTPFLKVMAGIPQVIGGVTRLVPLLLDDPVLIGLKLYAYDLVSIEGIGHNQQASPGGYYSRWKVTVAFRQYALALDGSATLATVDLDEGQRTLFGPGSAFEFGGTAPTFDVGVTVSTIVQRVTVFQLPTLDYTTWAGLANRTNVAPFNGNAAGTVLYRAPTASGVKTWGGQSTYQITHVFEYSSIPWNYEVQAGASAPALLTFQGGTYRYPLADFSVFGIG